MLPTSKSIHALVRLVSRTQLSKLLCVAVIALGLVSLPIGTAWAASWSVNSSGYCTLWNPGHWIAGGSSRLSWGGGWPWDSGNTTGYLWRWNGSNWIQSSTAFGSASGAANVASASPYTDIYSPPSIWWNETGAHTASFFSGQQNSYGSNFLCP